MRLRVVLIVAFLLLVPAALLARTPPQQFVGWVLEVSMLALSLACPLFFLAMLLAPLVGFPLSQYVEQGLKRLRLRRREIEHVKDRISHLDKPHHMAELGSIYLGQGRYARAAPWFEKALERDDTLLDVRYRLGICRFEMGRYEEAAELLEDVHREKPDHDYGEAYLYLARAQTLAGNPTRAREVYETLLRYYPGHPGGTYRYAQLLSQAGETEAARDQMRRVVSSVRRSPPFGRRRNRHWQWKAQWWLWRH